MKEKNPNGPIFVPKGNGLGWTVNAKRPVGWLIIAGVVAVITLTELTVSGVIKF